MGFRGSEPAMVGQGLVQRKTNEIRVFARIPNDSPPMGIIEIADNVFRRKIAEQSCLRRSIGGKRGMLHLSYMVICQIRKQAGIEADALHSVCGQRLRGNLHTTCVMPRSTIMRKKR